MVFGFPTHVLVYSSSASFAFGVNSEPIWYRDTTQITRCDEYVAMYGIEGVFGKLRKTTDRIPRR